MNDPKDAQIAALTAERDQLKAELDREERAFRVARLRIAALEKKLGEARKAIRDLYSETTGEKAIVIFNRALAALSATPPAQQPEKCPTCESPSPHLHPAMQYEGEVQPCRNSWHAAQQEKPE